MNYFLVQANNHLIHLSDFRVEEGKRELIEIPQVGDDPIFTQGRKLPDTCYFTAPSGAKLSPCLVVDEDAIIHSIIVSSPVDLSMKSQFIAGILQSKSEAESPDQAKAIIKQAIKELKG